MTAEQKSTLGEVIWVDQQRLSGTPCFKGTRVPVQNLLDYIEGGSTIDEFFEDYPSVTRGQIGMFLKLAKEQLVECVSSQTNAFRLV
ncbi:MAG: DUF433 domain-containing protein [Bryobacteraceae bacterium]